MNLLLSLIVIALIIVIINVRNQRDTLETALEDEKKIKETVNFNRKLNHNLNGKEIWMIDYENVCRLPDVLKENAENIVCYVFAANFQKNSLKRKIEEYKGKAVIETIITSKSTKNLNDLKIALYIGIIVTKFKPARIIIDSKDRDYSALFTALNELDIKNIELNQGDMKTRQDRRAIGAYFKLRSLLKYPEVISLKNFKTIMMNSMHLDNNSADMIIKRLEQLNYIEFTDNRYYKEIRLNR